MTGKCVCVCLDGVPWGKIKLRVAIAMKTTRQNY